MTELYTKPLCQTDYIILLYALSRAARASSMNSFTAGNSSRFGESPSSVARMPSVAAIASFAAAQRPLLLFETPTAQHSFSGHTATVMHSSDGAIFFSALPTAPKVSQLKSSRSSIPSGSSTRAANAFSAALYSPGRLFASVQTAKASGVNGDNASG